MIGVVQIRVACFVNTAEIFTFTVMEVKDCYFCSRGFNSSCLFHANLQKPEKELALCQAISAALSTSPGFKRKAVEQATPSPPPPTPSKRRCVECDATTVHNVLAELGIKTPPKLKSRRKFTRRGVRKRGARRAVQLGTVGA